MFGTGGIGFLIIDEFQAGGGQRQLLPLATPSSISALGVGNSGSNPVAIFLIILLPGLLRVGVGDSQPTEKVLRSAACETQLAVGEGECIPDVGGDRRVQGQVNALSIQMRDRTSTFSPVVITNV